jgi:hypothetical protein
MQPVSSLKARARGRLLQCDFAHELAAHDVREIPGLMVTQCTSAIQIVRPLESIAETQPQLQPPLLILPAMISQYFTR